jgi:hypothetical protein
MFGPWPDEQLRRIADFARIGSKSGQPRRLLHGSRTPTQVIRIYVRGKRAWPRNGQHLRGVDGLGGTPTVTGNLIAAGAGAMIGFGVGAEIERKTVPDDEGFFAGLDRALTFRVAGAGAGAIGGLVLANKLSEDPGDE